MAGSVNKVILIGNLGNDPEVKYLENGKAVAKFSIATTESYTNKQGERVDNTEWHRIEIWEGLAKVAEKYLKKGNQVYVEGRIRTDKWTDASGVEKYGVTIRANSMTLLGGNPTTPAGGITNGNQQQASSSRSGGSFPPASLNEGYDDDQDLPF